MRQLSSDVDVNTTRHSVLGIHVSYSQLYKTLTLKLTLQNVKAIQTRKQTLIAKIIYTTKIIIRRQEPMSYKLFLKDKYTSNVAWISTTETDKLTHNCKHQLEMLNSTY